MVGRPEKMDSGDKLPLGMAQAGALENALYRYAITFLFFSLILGNVAFLFGTYYAPEAGFGAWLVVHTGLTIARLFQVHGLNLVIARGWIVRHRERQVHLVGTLATGIVWGALPAFISPSMPWQLQIGVTTLMVGVTVAAMVAYRESPRVFAAFVAPIWLALIAWLMLHPDIDIRWLGVALSMLAAGEFVIVRRMWLSALRILDVHAQNRSLKADFAAARYAVRQETRQRRKDDCRISPERARLERGPVVTYRCAATPGWPIERISHNIAQFGYSARALSGQFYMALVDADDREFVRGFPESGSRDIAGADNRLEYRFTTAGGDTRWVMDHRVPVVNAAGKVSHFDGYLLDVSRLYAANERLSMEKERMQVTLESIGDAVITVNTHFRIDFMNAAAEQLTGWTFYQARFSRLAEIFVIREFNDAARIDDPVSFFMAKGDDTQAQHLQAELHARSGRRLLITYNVAPIRNHSDQVIGYVLVFLDVTEKVKLQRELEYQARHDLLTGIFNRREFEAQLNELLEQAQQENGRHILMYLDLDQFKLVNDTCGHKAGDHLLRVIAQKLRGSLRRTDTLARLGGDEFGVLLRHCTLDEGLVIGHVLLDALKATQFPWGERSFDIGVSIGMVAVTSSSDSVEQLMSHADVACFAAKGRGRHCIRVYQDSDIEIRQRMRDMDWATRITRSIEQGAFHLFYQEIVPVDVSRRNQSCHLEVLLRMRGENGEVILPETFLSSAERYNLMPLLDRWVIRETFRWYETLGTPRDLMVAINLSGLSLNAVGFLEYVRKLFASHRIPPTQVCFEITETAAIENLTVAGHFMRELRALGCRFALDDFGSGLSSFAYLKALPVDYLKIDGRFVQDMLTDKVDRAMVGAINEVGHTLELQTIAEFVEDEAILRELSVLKVDLAQGFALSYPQPLSEWQRSQAA
ncbi:MAG: EAL domain-containing protein [Thiotrichales bacterium]